MLRPICIKCSRFFKPKKTGFVFTEGMPINGNPPPGNAAPESWQPYKIWAGDLYECPACGTTIISGFGAKPIAVQHEADFEERCQHLNASQFQVNDC